MAEQIIVNSITPYDSFSKWMNDFLDIDFKFGKPYDYKFVSDFISDEEIKTWSHEVPVFISTETGTGKNFFIEWALHEFSQMEENHSQKPKILLLLNRTALSRQTKIRIANKLNDLRGDSQYLTEIKKHSAEGLDELHDFGPFEIYTYHQIEEKEILDKLQRMQMSYIICDECHFFTSDALINEKTATVMSSIVEYFYDAVRIYMSATPEVAFEPIVKKEKNMFTAFLEHYNDGVERERKHWQIVNMVTNNQSYFLPETRDQNEKMRVKYYYIERDYSYISNIIDLKLGDMGTDIERLIQKSEQEEKWMIFVHSKEKGAKLSEYLNRKFGAGFAVLVTSDDKDSETFKEIVEHERYSCRVLIATAVLDNGINIKDESVKHVVIDVFNRVQFLQMLGRVRVDKDDEKINLYVVGQDDKHIEDLMSYSIADLVLFIMYKAQGGNPGKLSFFRRRLYRGIEYYDDKKGFVYSANIWYELVGKITELRRIMRKITGNPEYKIAKRFKSQDDITNYAKAYNFCKEIHDGGDRNNLWDRIYDTIETRDRLEDRKKLAQRRSEAITKIENENVFLHYLIKKMLKQYENEYDKAIEQKKAILKNNAGADEKEELEKQITWLEEKLVYLGKVEQSLDDTVPDKNAAVAEYAYWLGRKPEEIEKFDDIGKISSDEIPDGDYKEVAETKEMASESELEPNDLPTEITSEEQAISLLEELAVSVPKYEAAKGNDDKNNLLLAHGCLKEEKYLEEVYKDAPDAKENEKIRQQKFRLVWDYFKSCTGKKKVEVIRAEKNGIRYEGKSEQLHTSTRRTMYFVLKSKIE